MKGYQNIQYIDVVPRIETELGDNFIVNSMERVGDYIVFSCSDNCIRTIKMPDQCYPQS